MTVAEELSEAMTEIYRREMLARRLPDMVDKFGWEAARAATDRLLEELAPDFEAYRQAIAEKVRNAERLH